jgi:hypothetical protein
MKIISLASYNGGEACSVFTCIKKYFYNDNCITDFFSYLEVSLESVNQILLMDEKYIDSYFKENYEIYLNKDGNYSVIFKNFDKMISHHDLIENNEESFNKVVERYKRRYYRFIDDIKNENKIFFIRYGKENPYSINYFITLIKKINPLLELYFINLYSENSYIFDKTIDNCFYINFLDYLDKDIIYHEDLFYKVMQYDWKQVYNVIYNLLNDKEKEDFNLYDL